MFLAAFNTLYIKYAVIACTFPLWLPFLRALYAELDDALAEEGGLFGRAPTQVEMAFIVKDPNRAKSPLVSKEFPEEPEGQARGRAATGKSPGRSAPAPKRRTGGLGSAGFSKARGVHGFARKDQRADKG